MTKIQNLALEMYEALERKTRDNGDVFYCLKDGAPEWMTDVIREAHGDMMPDDFKYEAIRDALSSLQDADDSLDDDEISDMAHEWADADVDIYNADLCRWLSSHYDRVSYVDEAIEEYGWDKERGILGAISMGQYAERRDVYASLIQSLSERAEALANENAEG